MKGEANNSKPSFFYSVGSFSVRRKWIVLVVLMGALVLAGPQLNKMQDRLSQGGFEVKGSESDQVTRAMKDDFVNQYQFSDLLVFNSKEHKATDASFKSVVQKTIAALKKAPGVAQLDDPYLQPDRSISPDGSTVIAVVGLSDTQDDVLKHNPILEKAVADSSRGSGVTALLTGSGPFYSEFSETTVHDLERAERIALPITMVILVFAFASLVAAGMPLIMGVISLLVSFGVISLVASMTTVSLFTQNIASMIGLGVGIDYSLFILTRYREELKAGKERVDAVARAIATSGKAVFVSALTVVVALSGTQLVNLPAFRSMGFGSMIAVSFAGAAALTLLPALLGIVGKRINSLSFSKKTVAGEAGGVWRRWAHFIMRRPLVPLLASVAVLGFLASPVTDLRLGSSGPSILPEDAKPRVALELMSEAFGAGQVGPVTIVLQHDKPVTGEGFSEVYAAATEIARDSEVLFVSSIATIVPGAPVGKAQAVLSDPQLAPLLRSQVSKDGRATILRAVTKHDPISEEAQALVARLRSSLPRALPDSVTTHVGGDPGLNYDINEEVTSSLPSVVAVVLALSYFVLLLFLRSVLLPLKAIIMNLLSVLAAYGLVVFIFQKGNFEDLLGFKSSGIVESFLPLFLFCVLFGLSMDYEVFMLARIREEYLKTGDNTEAVGWGLEHTARIITSAAAVMVTVFGAFAMASLVPIKAMGFGLAAAVFLDATIIRIVLVPAAMRLMGDWNWWIPRWLDRLLPAVSLEEQSPTASPASV